MSVDRSSNDLSWSPNPGRALLKLAWPITVSMVSFSTMTLVSTAFVASVGKDELAGVGLGGVIYIAFICFGIGLLRGAKTLVSQAVGAGRQDRIPALLGGALLLAVVLGVTATLACLAIAPAIAALSAEPRAGELAAQYLAIRAFAAPLNLVYCALREARYGEGDTRSPMRASIVGNVVNIALDVVLILGLELGVEGAAIATLCGTASELLVLALATRARLARATISRRAVRDVWAQGLPNGLQFIMEVGSFLLLTVLVARMSALDGAAHQIVLHLVNVSFLPAHALAEAASVLVGQAVGANQDALVPKVAKRALWIGGVYATIVMVVYAVLGGTIATGFAAGDVALADRATLLVHISLGFLVTDAANVIARGVLRGASDVRYAAVVGIVSAWLCTPPLTWLLGVHLGLGAAGGWIGLAAEILVGAVILWWRVFRGGWRVAAAKARREMAGTAV